MSKTDKCHYFQEKNVIKYVSIVKTIQLMAEIRLSPQNSHAQCKLSQQKDDDINIGT